MSDDELKALLKAAQGRGFRERRDEAIIRFLLDAGVRVSESCGLTIDREVEGTTIPGTLDLDSGSALVTGKRGKQRVVYFGARTERALDRYLRVRRSPRWAHLDALFLTQRGAVSPDGVRDMLELRAGQAGRPIFCPGARMSPGSYLRRARRTAGQTSP
ncbi:MAG TPA: tyrosine-type recombinase/integrase [Amycolatopsis sp.]|nr:tyrosine-type recombinase/integrase [Amycolatopsis sp.]HVV10012.1 tyrosine-type recombinase/integrase [Amycolatopsis sp.]